MNEDWISDHPAEPAQLVPPGAEQIDRPADQLQEMLDEWVIGFAHRRDDVISPDLSLGSRGLHPDEAASFLRAIDSGLIEVDEAGFVRVPGLRPKKTEGVYALFSRNGDAVALNTEYLIQMGTACELVTAHGWPAGHVAVEVGEFDAVVEQDGRTIVAMEAKARVEGSDGLARLLRSFVEFANAAPPEPKDNHSRKYADLLRRAEAGPVTLWLVAAGARWAFVAERIDDQLVLTEGTIERQEAHAETFTSVARTAAERWKSATTVLPDEARPPAAYRGRGEYPFCLPEPFAALNLLPEARQVALDRFAAAGIPWHDGIDGGPSNHLLSSQVMCTNALAPLVSDPDALQAVFGGHLPIAQVLPFGAETDSRFDASDHVVFEWNGAQDHLGEREGTSGTRGAHSTSADAAIRYRTTDGETEIALIEWKYTEQYRGQTLSGGASSMQTRHDRYRRLYDDPKSPIRSDLVDYTVLFREPLYQLMRQQLLAWRMEATGELGADRVRVVLVAPLLNRQLAESYDPALADAVGWHGPSPSVHDVWRQLLRRPDRFVHIDAASLIAPESPVSTEFRSRYGHIARVSAAASLRGAEELRHAADTASALLQRVGAEGGVLQQITQLSDDEIGRLDPLFLRALVDRLRHLAEDTRRLRAEEIFEALRGGDTQA